MTDKLPQRTITQALALAASDPRRRYTIGAEPPLVLRPDLRPKPRPRRAHVEQDLQIAVAKALGYLLLPPAWFTAIPAGGGGKMRGAILKGMGYFPGTADLLLTWPVESEVWNKLKFPAIGWCELKSATGRQSPEQIAFQARVEAVGHRYALCRSLDSVIDQLAAWGVPTRAHK